MTTVLHPKLLVPLLILAALPACSDSVPAVADPHNIVIDGKPMTAAEFLRQYCAGKANHPTCASVAQASRKDDTHRGVPRF